jgi:hypothetical protein
MRVLVNRKMRAAAQWNVDDVGAVLIDQQLQGSAWALLPTKLRTAAFL